MTLSPGVAEVVGWENARIGDGHMIAIPTPAQGAGRYALIAAGSVLAVALALWIGYPWHIWSAAELLALLACTAVAVYIACIQAHLNRELWVLYINMVLLATWLALGAAAGLLTLLLTFGLTAFIRWRWQSPGAAARTVFVDSARYTGAIGLALLLAAALYAALDGETPLRALRLDTVLAPIVVVPIALIAALTLLRLLSGETVRRSDFLKFPRRDYYLRVVATLIVVMLSPVILYQNGVAVFMLIQVLIVMQVHRHAQADRASRALEQRLQEFALLNSVSRAISTTLVLDDVLMAIYQHTGELIHVRGLYVALHNPSQGTLDFRLAIVDGAPALWHSRRAEADYAAERVIRTGQIVHLVRDARSGALPPEPNAADVDYGAYLGLPLTVGSHVLGVLAVFSVASDAFTPQTINTLQTIASQAALAVRNAVLFAQRSQLVEGLSHINDSVQNVLFNPNRQQALLAACQTALAITRANRAAIYLLQPGEAVLHLENSIGLSAGEQERFMSTAFQRERYAPGPHVVVDARQQPDSAHLAEAGIIAYVEMPLLSGEQIRGLLAVYHPEPHAYTLTELYLLETLANQITAMLENAQLIQLLELYAFEMTQLVDLSWILSASTDLDAIVNGVARIMQDMTSASRIALLLLDADNQRVEELASSSSNGAGPASRKLRALSALPELAALAAGEQFRPCTYHADSPNISSTLSAQMREHNERTVALIPLRAAESFLGAILLGSVSAEGFSDREWQLMEMAANQIAVHIRNVQLYEQTRADLDQRLEQLSVAEELAKQVSSSLDFNQIIGNVLDAALRVTQADAAAVALLTDAGPFWVIEQRIENGSPVRVDSAQPRDAGVMGQVVRAGQPIRVADNTVFPGYYTGTPGVYRSSLAVPLFSSDEVVGVLNVESVRRDFFTERQAAFLASLASHAVISIENARFLAEREHQIGMLTSLRTLSLRLASADSTQAVAAAVLETGQAILRSHCALAFRRSEATGALTAVAGSGPDCGGLELGDHALPRAVALEAVQRRQPSFVRDTRAHPAYDAGSAPAYVSAVAVPLEHHGQITYVLFFGFFDEHDLQDRDLHTIELLASQAAGHLENALLHEQLRAGRDQMRAILDSARAGVILLDTDFRLEAVNPSAERLLGISLEPHIGSYFPDVLLHELEAGAETGYTRQQIAEVARILWEQPEVNTRREFYHRRQNQLVYIEEVGSPVLNDAGRIIGRLLVLQDITEAKLLDEHREDLTRMLIHDLRGPLGAIISGIDGGLYTLDTPPDAPNYAASIEDTRALLRASHISANRLLRLVNSLLDVSRLEGREIELDTQPVALVNVAQTVYTALAASAQQARIRVVVDVPADLPLARADCDMIERVVINLLDNAVRYTPEGGEVRISACYEPPGMLRVRVADSGPGIPLQVRDHIFEKFGRAQDNRPLRGAHGLGLGLTFCKLAVEAHGGSISIEDGCEPGGACFTFTLPTV